MNSNNPLKLAASRFLQGVQQAEQRQQGTEDDDDMPSACFSCTHEDEEQAVEKEQSGTTPPSPTTTLTAISSVDNSDDKLQRENVHWHDTHHVLSRMRILVLTAILLLGAYTAWRTFQATRGNDTEQESNIKDNVKYIGKSMVSGIVEGNTRH